MMINKVNSIIQDILPLAIQLYPEMSLKNDLGIDSLRLVELIIALEDGINIRFKLDDLDINNFILLSDLYKLINAYEEKNDLPLS